MEQSYTLCAKQRRRDNCIIISLAAVTNTIPSRSPCSDSPRLHTLPRTLFHSLFLRHSFDVTKEVRGAIAVAGGVREGSSSLDG
jgi:hypothetical protein